MMLGCGRKTWGFEEGLIGNGDVTQVPSEVTLESMRYSNEHDESGGRKPQEGRQSRERQAELDAK
jgi:hypothetical protein